MSGPRVGLVLVVVAVAVAVAVPLGVARATDAAPETEEATGLAALEALPPSGLDHRPETCARCHRRVVRQWEQSGHAAAFSSPRFQAAWAPRSQGWCVHCHAPLRSQQDVLHHGVAIDPSARVGVPEDATVGPPGDGVACAACHLRAGTVRTPGPPSIWARLAHPAEEDPALTDGRRCASCHEFAFPLHTPVWPFALGTTPLQSTWSEWQGSAAARDGTGCVDCHFPRGRHHLPGSTRAGMVEDALSVEFLVGCGEVGLRLSAEGAAHAVPTGDPFRALELRLCAEDCADEEPVAVVRFGQAFAPDAATWQLVSDTRIPPAVDGSRATATATVAVSSPVGAYALWLQLADRRHAHLDPAHQGRVVRRGTLPAPEEPCP